MSGEKGEASVSPLDTEGQTQTLEDTPGNSEVRDISGTGLDRPQRTLVSFDRLAEFERGEATSGGRRLTRPGWLRVPDWYERAARNPRVIRVSQGVTAASIAVGVLAVAWFVQAKLSGRPVIPSPGATETVTLSPVPRGTSPQVVLPVEPKVPTPPRPTLTPQRTRGQESTQPPSARPPAAPQPKPTTLPTPEPPSGGDGSDTPDCTTDPTLPGCEPEEQEKEQEKEEQEQEQEQCDSEPCPPPE